ncbi:MAG: hypothetical protein HRT35_09090 [Algicola sp.]|nr:hypothetical protein [Algicola sp.]
MHGAHCLCPYDCQIRLNQQPRTEHPTDKVDSALGITLTKVDGKFVKKWVGSAIFGVPSVAHKEKGLLVFDPDLKHHDTIWAAAGTPNAVFALKPDELDLLTDGTWVTLVLG